MRSTRTIRKTAVILLLAIAHFAPALAQRGNYVRTEVMLDADGTHVADNVQFFDGLGRPTVSATNSLGGQGLYAYCAQTYRWGAACDKWLPAVGTTTLDEPDTDGVAALAATTYGESCAFSHTSRDALGRTLAVLRPGEAWHSSGKAVTTAYTTNETGSVIRYAVDAGENPVRQGFYEARTLDGILTTDEDGHTLAVYSDPSGRKLLERRGADNDTYYVYDDLGRLRFVLTPQFQHEASPERYAYEYRYDSRGNVIWKRLPGCDPVRYWRDRGDRIVREQDGVLHERGLCRLFLYDGLGRLSKQGVTGLYGETVCSDTILEKTLHYDTYDFLGLPVFRTHAAFCAICDSLPKACASALPTGMTELTSRRDTLLTVWAYDRHGNTTAAVRTLPGGALLTTQTTYSFTRKPVRVAQTLTRSENTSTAIMEIEYNAHNDQPCKTTLTIDGGTPAMVEETAYNSLGQIESIRQGNGNIATGYAYNVRGWTTSITGTGLEERLSYHDGTGTPRYNGDISMQLWRTANDSIIRGYQFSYDALDRLTSSVYGEGATLTTNQGRYNETVKGYTANGAITGIARNGKTDSGYGLTDNLTYTLNGNQLERVDDAAAPVLHSGAFDFTDNTVETDGTEYAYNANGALAMDANRGITRIEYDNGNHPVLIQFADGSRTEYVYTASGEKLRTVHRKAVRDITVGLGEARELTKEETLSLDSTDYCGNFIIENGHLDKYLFGSGYYAYGRTQQPGILEQKDVITGDIQPHNLQTASLATLPYGPSSGRLPDSLAVAFPEDAGKAYLFPTLHYYAKDHLGNVRAVLSASGKVEQATHYYPFGAVIADISTGAPLQKRKFSGKELDLMHGLNTYDFGARQYDPLLGVWDRADRFSEKYYFSSPYVMCIDNPMRWWDYQGDKIIPVLYSQIDNHGYAIPHTYYSYVPYINAMERFGETEYGAQFLGQFVDVGRSHYGVNGTGENSDINFVIREFYLPKNQNYLYMENNYGQFHIAEYNNTLNFILDLDCKGVSENELLETIVHELSLHGYKVQKYIEAYKEGGFEAAKALYEATPASIEHNEDSEGAEIYKSIENFLIEKDSSIKETFDYRIKIREK